MMWVLGGVASPVKLGKLGSFGSLVVSELRSVAGTLEVAYREPYLAGRCVLRVLAALAGADRQAALARAVRRGCCALLTQGGSRRCFLSGYLRRRKVRMRFHCILALIWEHEVGHRSAVWVEVFAGRVVVVVVVLVVEVSAVVPVADILVVVVSAAVSHFAVVLAQEKAEERGRPAVETPAVHTSVTA